MTGQRCDLSRDLDYEKYFAFVLRLQDGRYFGGWNRAGSVVIVPTLAGARFFMQRGGKLAFESEKLKNRGRSFEIVRVGVFGWTEPVRDCWCINCEFYPVRKPANPNNPTDAEIVEACGEILGLTDEDEFDFESIMDEVEVNAAEEESLKIDEDDIPF